MTVTELKLHPRFCNMCNGDASKIYKAIWNTTINDRISFCSKFCFETYINEWIEGFSNMKKPLLERRYSI